MGKKLKETLTQDVDLKKAKDVLTAKYSKVVFDEQKENLRVYDLTTPEDVVKTMYEKGVVGIACAVFTFPDRVRREGQ